MASNSPFAQELGPTGRVAVYEIADDQLAVGSTLGGPKVAAIIKANGAIEKVFGIDAGMTLIGTIILRHYDGQTGMYLAQDGPGTFVIHPEHQEHHYRLANGLDIREDIFVLCTAPSQGNGKRRSTDDPPAVYQVVEIHNGTAAPQALVTYAFALLRGETDHDVQACFNRDVGAIIAWNEKTPELARIIGCSRAAESYETTLDFAKAVSERCPGPLSCQLDAAPQDPLGVLHHSFRLKPGETQRYYYQISLGNGAKDALKNYKACPRADKALERTRAYYAEALGRSVVLTPDPVVNRGVLWAKANMLRVEAKAPTGWCFTNDPTRSNNSVGRDTAWFAFGADYVTQDFAREALLAYVRRQEKSGMYIEYYDIRSGKTEDYGLNINDNTPLLIMALWHHYNTTGDIEFLREVYPSARKAARYILSQRNEQGLVWCNATGTADWGIVGWRNVIPNYRLSGATTEVNSECYAALRTISHMARVLGHHDESAQFAREADDLRTAINSHLFDPDTGLYYLNIDVDGNTHSDITSDLVFPVIFGVADDRTAAAIIGRLSSKDFWTPAGIRTVPRDSPTYTPNLGWGLLGGVWVGVSFWYALAAAPHSPAFMARALSTSFQNYSANPRQNNTVPGQFSEWLHGETLVNEGMMLSPWFPPRYVWAAIEGMCGLQLSGDSIGIAPRLAPEWKWLALQNLPYRGQPLTFFAVRVPDLRIYANFRFPGDTTPYALLGEDVTSTIETTGDAVCTIGLRQNQKLTIFVGNTSDETVNTAVRIRDNLAGEYRVSLFDSLIGEWTKDNRRYNVEELSRGLIVRMEQKGFCLLDLQQEV